MYFQYNTPGQTNLSPVPQRYPDQYGGPNNNQEVPSRPATKPYSQQQRAPSPNPRPQQTQHTQQPPHTQHAQHAPHSPHPQRTQPNNNVSKPQAPKPQAPKPQAPAPAPKKSTERRISTMTEVQIMEKLRSVVSQGDPTTLYSKIKKVGQG